MRSAVDHTIKTRLLLRPLRSPLGTLRLGGINQGGFGVGRPPGPRRTLNCFGFAYIMNGEGVYRDRLTAAMPIKRGNLVLFFPGRPHQCGTRPGEFWDELWFEFEGPVFDLLARTRVLDPRRPVCATPDPEREFRRFFEIVPPLHLRQTTPPEVTVSRFATALTEVLAGADVARPAPDRRDEWIDTACGLLATHENEPGVHPSDVARRLGQSYESFRKRFRQQMGFSPGQFQLDSRIDRAAALLHQGRLAIKEIAAQLGFCDEFHFSRIFKRRFGQSPRDFRRRVRG